MVYFPEVLWAIFHSIVGNNDEIVHKSEQVKNIMKRLKLKYPGLDRNITPDSLCGNKFYKTQITVSKYLSALGIINFMKNLKSRKI